LRQAIPITLTDEERTTLCTWSRSRIAATRMVIRAKIVLLAASGLENQAIAEKLERSRISVRTWRQRFVEKLVDVVGLYRRPPQNALVLSVDEKSQIQALDRTQPGLPLKKGRCGTMTHDYQRNGTTALFAALELATGQLIGRCMKRHRHQEWLQFLKLIDEQTPAHLDLHLIADNYSTHKHAKVQSWLARHPRFHMHFVPTSSSWLNLVERWFRNITTQRIRRGSFRNVEVLEKAIEDYIAAHNHIPNPSFGPPISRTSSPRSFEPIKHSIRIAINETLH